MNKSNPDERK